MITTPLILGGTMACLAAILSIYICKHLYHKSKLSHHQQNEEVIEQRNTWKEKIYSTTNIYTEEIRNSHSEIELVELTDRDLTSDYISVVSGDTSGNIYSEIS